MLCFTCFLCARGLGGEEAKMENNKEEIVDVGSVVEAVSADDSDAPLYQVESLCMRCGENVTV